MHRSSQQQPSQLPGPFGAAGTRSELVEDRVGPEEGRYIHPDRFGVEFNRLVETAPVPRIRLHDLRHTHATLLLGEGVPIKVVSERLGHAAISITLDVYAHCLPAMDQGAAEHFADMIWNGGQPADNS